MKVWYNLAGIANVISLKTVKSMIRVTYDSKDRGGVLTMHTNKGKIEFILHLKGVNYLNLDECDSAGLLMADSPRKL